MAVKIEVQVLPEDVEHGRPTCGACPLVLAVKRALDEAGAPGLHAIVLPANSGPMRERRYNLEVALWGRERELLAWKALPDDLCRALLEFDAAHGSDGGRLRDVVALSGRWPPFEFDLDLSEAAMAQLRGEQ